MDNQAFFDQRIKIDDVWYALGGKLLQGLGNELRGSAFWRESSDLNITINTEKNTWCDHAHGEHETYGGTSIALIRIVLNYSQDEAINWLETKGLTRKIPPNQRGKTTSARSSLYHNKNTLYHEVIPKTGLVLGDVMRTPRREPDGIYSYFYKNGSLAFNVRRWEKQAKTKKFCIPQCFIGNRWRNGLPSGPLPLYHLPDLLKHPEHPVLIVEGEKCVESAQSRLPEYVVITWSGGSSSGQIHKTDWTPLQGRNVFLWPDRDNPGRKAIQTIAAKLKAIGSSTITIVDPGDGEDGWDVADFSNDQDLSCWITEHLIQWQETEQDFERGENGRILKIPKNIEISFKKLGITVYYNLFTTSMELKGIELPGHHALSKPIRSCIRSLIAERWHIITTTEEIENAIGRLCFNNQYHPVRDYLDALKWDRVPRIAKWLTTFLGAEDNRYNNEVGLLTLIAAVRRVRQPGCAFDYMPILVGPQGTGKSKSIEILGKNWYAGNLSFSSLADTRLLIERTSNKWIIEGEELTGFRNSDINLLKSILTCTTDTARLAYGRAAKDVKRQFIIIGTTNDVSFLRDLTGNRRYLPVPVFPSSTPEEGEQRRQLLREQVDQLWAEAAFYEQGMYLSSLVLPSDICQIAAEKQELHREKSWTEEELEAHYGDTKPGVFIANAHIWQMLNIESHRDKQTYNRQVAAVMRRLGFISSRSGVDGLTQRGWIKK